MGRLTEIINNAVENSLSCVNTLMLCTVVSTNPLAIQPFHVQRHVDGTTEQRPLIQNPINLDNKIYNKGDLVVVGFLQEVTEGGATRKFDISDAVILGQAGKAGQYSGNCQFAKYAKGAESSKTAAGTGESPQMKDIPELKGSDGTNESW